ncbi:hypothetical protein CRBSH125_03840 [Afipia carboxidovorans]|nr:hypothetical protein CRBSH125_03840 [Afipia carboxidovorans]
MPGQSVEGVNTDHDIRVDINSRKPAGDSIANIERMSFAGHIGFDNPDGRAKTPGDLGGVVRAPVTNDDHINFIEGGAPLAQGSPDHRAFVVRRDDNRNHDSPRSAD